MASVLDRPLFQRKATEARDRLKQLGNIGGYDFGAALPVQAQPDFSQAVDVFQDTTERAAQDAVPPASTIPKVVAPASQNKRYVIGRAVFIKKPNGIVTYENGDPIDIGQAETIRGIIAQQDRNAGQELAQRNENALTGMYEGKFPVSEKALRENPSGLPPSPMEADARNRTGRTLTPEGVPVVAAKNESGVVSRPDSGPAPAAAKAAEKPMGPTTMEADARGRKPMTITPADVATALNDPTPEVREKTAADFAKEYAEFAPKYEGVDKGLMLAQIGFAIAAGESPNAMSNIANGLLAGSDAMIKDKAAKAEFDRQVKLNAMQYGFEEQGRERERGKPSLQFTALKDMTIKGRKVAEGDPVFLSYKDIEDAGGTVPSGLVDAATYTALAEKESGVLKAMQDQYDRGVMDDSDLRANVETYTGYVNQVAQSQRALDYFEKSLFIIGKDGEVTGAKGALKSFVGKLAGFAGVDVAQLDSWAAAGDTAKLNEVLSRAVLDSVPSVLAGQSANSISNKDVDLAVGRLVEGAVNGGSFTNIFQNEDALIRQIQDSMGVIAANRQRAFAGMSSIEAQLANRYTKAGDFYAPSYASDVIAPLRGSVGLETTYGDPSTFGDITVGENGVWKLVLPGG